MKEILKGFGAATFGELYADEYDERHDPGTTDAAVALLTDIADGRRTLELAVGTGRVALPMLHAGVDIEGIDASPEMLAKLKDKAGRDKMTVLVANMADFDLDRSFEFVFLVFNTFYNLTSQEAQINCIKSAADHLDPGGHLLLEMFVHDYKLFSGVRVEELDMNSLVLEAAEHDPVTQTVEFQRVMMTDGSIRMRPLAMRYAWPSEIDLMARLAGLELESRWSDWHRSPYS